MLQTNVRFAQGFHTGAEMLNMAFLLYFTEPVKNSAFAEYLLRDTVQLQ